MTMPQQLKFLFGRLVTYMLVVLFGVTFIFFIPRMLPVNPVDAMLGRILSQGSYMQEEQVAALRSALSDAFGLNGTLAEQYFGFLKRALISHDFGPSLAMYPTPVSDLVLQALPWTFGLLITAVLIAWLVGNAIGLITGSMPNSRIAKALEGVAIVFYPIPYFVLALVLSILLSYVWKVFPLTTTIRGTPFSWEFVSSVVYHSFLPALSIILVTFGWWMLSMRALSRTLMDEDFVTYGRLKGLSQSRLMLRYVLPNAMLPQLTYLALQLGLMFNGSIITEIVFNYPGIGSLIYTAIAQGDYNLLMGTVTISIIAVSTATLILDLVYPLIDPRIRQR
jgi:peptide/nickel transport system permease protein